MALIQPPIPGPQGPQGPQGPVGPQGPGLAAGGTTGQILRKASDTEFDTAWQDAANVTKEPTGFQTRATSSISFNNATRTFTITPIGGQFIVHQAGIRYTKTVAESLVIPDVEGAHWIYYNLGVLTSTNVFNRALFEFPVAALVQWDFTNKVAILFGDKRHGVVMDKDTQYSILVTEGAKFVNGFAPTNYNAAGDGSADSHAQISIDDGILLNQDIDYVITHANPVTQSYQQILDPVSQIPVLYRLGTNGPWRKDTATTFPVKQGAARIQYNALAGNVWSTADITNGSFLNMWIIATFSQVEPIMVILGQTNHGSLAAAQSEQPTAVNLTGLPIQNGRLICKVIYQSSNSYTNVPHARIREVQDYRTSAFIGSTLQGPAGVGIPAGGTTGQILKKNSNLNYDTIWADSVTELASRVFINDYITNSEPSPFGSIFGTNNIVGNEQNIQSGGIGWQSHRSSNANAFGAFPEVINSGNPSFPFGSAAQLQQAAGMKFTIETRWKFYNDLLPTGNEARYGFGFLERLNHNLSAGVSAYGIIVNGTLQPATSRYFARIKRASEPNYTHIDLGLINTSPHTLRLEFEILAGGTSILHRLYWDKELINTTIFINENWGASKFFQAYYMNGAVPLGVSKGISIDYVALKIERAP